MKINSAKFVKGVGGTDPIFDQPIPQIAFIGRSNVGKSSLINSLTGVKDLAITSSHPGRTQEINLFLVNNSVYFVDLPGYGYAKASGKVRERIQQIIRWYFFESACVQEKVVLIVDAEVGVTASDQEMLAALLEHGKNIIIVANKIDKIPKSAYARHMDAIHAAVGDLPIIPYSSESHVGQAELADAVLK